MARRGGFLLHAASAICDGQALPVLGNFGGGQDHDDANGAERRDIIERRNFLRSPNEQAKVQPGARPYLAFDTPFAGELAKAGENTSAPIAGLFFLEKGLKNCIDELSRAEAVRRLMRNILFFAEDPPLVEELLATACAFVASLPIRRLTFYPDVKVWDEVRRFGREPRHACLSATG